MFQTPAIEKARGHDLQKQQMKAQELAVADGYKY